MKNLSGDCTDVFCLGFNENFLCKVFAMFFFYVGRLDSLKKTFFDPSLKRKLSALTAKKSH